MRDDHGSRHVDLAGQIVSLAPPVAGSPAMALVHERYSQEAAVPAAFVSRTLKGKKGPWNAQAIR